MNIARTTKAGMVLSGLALLAACGAMLSVSPSRLALAADDRYSSLPDSITLTGVARDFKERSVAGGHADFERQPTAGFRHYVNQAADELDADGKPAHRSSGTRLVNQWKDASGRFMIAPRSYIATRPGDVGGSLDASKTGSVSSANTFSQWWRDVPGMNMSKQVAITLRRQAGTNIYTFNDRTDPGYANKGGFFPINGELYGNSSGNDRNFHFSYELETQFVYERNTGQVFSFTGDDDVYVYIDNKLVIDLGGVHGAISQSIDLDRLNWLQTGQTYKLKFFFAERHRTQSNFRVDTTLRLRTVEPPATSGVFD